MVKQCIPVCSVSCAEHTWNILCHWSTHKEFKACQTSGEKKRGGGEVGRVKAEDKTLPDRGEPEEEGGGKMLERDRG